MWLDNVISLLIRFARPYEGAPLTVLAVFIAAMFWGWAVGRTCK